MRVKNLAGGSSGTFTEQLHESNRTLLPEPSLPPNFGGGEQKQDAAAATSCAPSGLNGGSSQNGSEQIKSEKFEGLLNNIYKIRDV